MFFRTTRPVINVEPMAVVAARQARRPLPPHAFSRLFVFSPRRVVITDLKFHIFHG